MKNLALKLGLLSLSALAIVTGAKADTFTDNFNTTNNYLANGVKGTIWDGIYLAPGDFPNVTLGNAAGVISAVDANSTSNNTTSPLVFSVNLTSWLMP